jgi:hypothetical protein
MRKSVPGALLDIRGFAFVEDMVSFTVFAIVMVSFILLIV